MYMMTMNNNHFSATPTSVAALSAATVHLHSQWTSRDELHFYTHLHGTYIVAFSGAYHGKLL
jgi:hypothetical protein